MVVRRRRDRHLVALAWAFEMAVACFGWDMVQAWCLHSVLDCQLEGIHLNSHRGGMGGDGGTGMEWLGAG
jgi:hypothetical protein